MNAEYPKIKAGYRPIEVGEVIPPGSFFTEGGDWQPRLTCDIGQVFDGAKYYLRTIVPKNTKPMKKFQIKHTGNSHLIFELLAKFGYYSLNYKKGHKRCVTAEEMVEDYANWPWVRISTDTKELGGHTLSTLGYATLETIEDLVKVLVNPPPEEKTYTFMDGEKMVVVSSFGHVVYGCTTVAKEVVDRIIEERKKLIA